VATTPFADARMYRSRKIACEGPCSRNTGPAVDPDQVMKVCRPSPITWMLQWQDRYGLVEVISAVGQVDDRPLTAIRGGGVDRGLNLRGRGSRRNREDFSRIVRQGGRNRWRV